LWTPKLLTEARGAGLALAMGLTAFPEPDCFLEENLCMYAKQLVKIPVQGTRGAMHAALYHPKVRWWERLLDWRHGVDRRTSATVKEL
jgi:hypothetical protein